MTFAKTGTEFPDDAFNVELSDAAYRTHHEAITYLFRVERTDCYVRTDEVRRFGGSRHTDMAVQELVNIGWWCIERQGYEVIHHADVIRSGIYAQQKQRATSKATSRRYRAKKHADVTDDVTRHVTHNADRQTDRQSLEGGKVQERVKHNGGALEDEPPW